MGFLRGIGTTELIIVLVIVLLIFGAAKLPQLGSSIGKAIKEFRHSVREPETKEPAPKKRPRKTKTS